MTGPAYNAPTCTPPCYGSTPGSGGSCWASPSWRGRARLSVGRRPRGPLGPKIRSAGGSCALFDVQFLLGLLMYVAFSPITHAAFSDIGTAMGQTLLRFYTVEHPLGMIAALACAHIGRARADRVRRRRSRARRTTALFFGIALVLMLVSIPWPFLPAGRPYFRW